MTYFHEGTAEALLTRDVVEAYLKLREYLVRFDENAKAWALLNAVPYWATDHPAIVEARAQQREMVAHMLEPGAYSQYYATNVHERPFEQQYGIEVSEADRIPRVAFLAKRLGAAKRILDIGCNDAWMIAHLHARGLGSCFDGIDLNRGNVTLAKQRQRQAGWTGQVVLGDALDRPPEIPVGHYDAVVMFEVLEHLADPAGGLQVAADYVKPGGHLFVSTPNGAVEGGNLPTWAHVERKGHLHSLRPSDFHDLLEAVGEVVAFDTGPDGVMVAKVKPR